MKGEAYPGVIGPTQEEITWANSQKEPIGEPKGWLKRAGAVASLVTGLGVAGAAINAPDASAAINEDVGSLPSSSFSDKLVFTRPSQNQPNALGEEALVSVSTQNDGEPNEEETPILEEPGNQETPIPEQEIPILEGEQEFIPIISPENPVSFFGRVSKENSRVFQSITGLEVGEGLQLTLNGSLDATGLPNVVGGIGILDANRGNVQFHLDYTSSNGWDAYFRYLDSAGKAQIVRKNFSGTNLDPVNDFSITFRPGGNVAVSLGTGEQAFFSNLPDDVLTTGVVRVGTYVAGNESVLNIKSLNYAVGEATVQPTEPTPEPAPPKEPPKEPLETGWETRRIINLSTSVECPPGSSLKTLGFLPGLADIEVGENTQAKILAQLSLDRINPNGTPYTVGGLIIENLTPDRTKIGPTIPGWSRILIGRAQGVWEIAVGVDQGNFRRVAVVADDLNPSTSATFEITLNSDGHTGTIRSLESQEAKIKKFDLGQSFYLPEQRALRLLLYSQDNTKTTTSRLEISTQTAQSK